MGKKLRKLNKPREKTVNELNKTKPFLTPILECVYQCFEIKSKVNSQTDKCMQ